MLLSALIYKIFIVLDFIGRGLNIYVGGGGHSSEIAGGRRGGVWDNREEKGGRGSNTDK